jgi:hypothetical protein
MVDYLAKNYLPRGKETGKSNGNGVSYCSMSDKSLAADIQYSARGFIAHEENNIFGSTGPRSGGEYAVFPLGSTWMVCMLQRWSLSSPER